MQKIKLLILITAAVLSLTACSSGSENNSADNTDSSITQNVTSENITQSSSDNSDNDVSSDLSSGVQNSSGAQSSEPSSDTPSTPSSSEPNGVSTSDSSQNSDLNSSSNSQSSSSTSVFLPPEIPKAEEAAMFTKNSTVDDVKSALAFGDFGRLLFPVDRSVSGSMTLDELSTSGVYVWYNDIKTDKTVEILNFLKAQSEAGNQVFFNIYSEEEMTRDSSKRDTGLFFFRGNEGEKFAVMNAGGGFMYVGAMHDSFPHALEASKNGYNAFALIYRPDDPYSDLARAIEFIHDNAETLGVDPDNYSLWGGSAGARMAAELGNYDRLKSLTGRTDIPQAAAVIMQYTGYTSTSESDAPTYACFGTNDGIASWRTMQSRLETLSGYGIPTEFHAYEELPHGFGLGTGTVADGWFDDALEFWEEQT